MDAFVGVVEAVAVGVDTEEGACVGAPALVGWTVEDGAGVDGA